MCCEYFSRHKIRLHFDTTPNFNRTCWFLVDNGYAVETTTVVNNQNVTFLVIEITGNKIKILTLLNENNMMIGLVKSEMISETTWVYYMRCVSKCVLWCAYVLLWMGCCAIMQLLELITSPISNYYSNERYNMGTLPGCQRLRIYNFMHVSNANVQIIEADLRRE